jgi:hypothetical protein
VLRSSSGKKVQGRDCLGWPQRAKTRPLILAQAATRAPAIECTSEFNRIWPVQASGKNRFCVWPLCGIARAEGSAAPVRDCVLYGTVC